jgi:hypothetical protein
MTYDCEIIDRCEGTVNCVVEADSEEEAAEEAGIYAAESGCCFVDEIICYERT